MVRPVNLSSVIVERKYVFIRLKMKKTFLPDKFQSVSYIRLKLVDECLSSPAFGNASIKSSGLSSRLPSFQKSQFPAN